MIDSHPRTKWRSPRAQAGGASPSGKQRAGGAGPPTHGLCRR